MNFNTKDEQFLNKDTILSKITEEQIFRKYITYHFTIGIPFLSPLREEINPSFSIYYNKSNQLRYKDFNGTQGTCFDFVMNLYNISFIECLHKINEDFNLNLLAIIQLNETHNYIKPLHTKETTLVQKPKKLLQVSLRRFNPSDYRYWIQFGIDRDLLQKYHVRAIKEVFLNRQRRWTTSYSNPIYGYYFPETDHYKLYRPLETDKKNKWLGTVTGEDTQGHAQLPWLGDLLVITKSMKDVMCLKSIGIDSIAPQGEDHYFSEDLMKQLKHRFTRIVCWYDNDSAGVNGSIKLTQMYDLDYVNIPKGLPKDPSDYYKEFGRDKLIEFCKTKQLIT